MVGTRFRFQGCDPATGLDCVGLVWAAYAAAGRRLVRPVGGTRELEVDVSLNAQHITSSTRIASFDQGEARTRLYSVGVQTVYRGTGHLLSGYTAINGGSYQPPFGPSRSIRTVNSTGSWAMVINEQWWLNTRAGVQWASGVDIPATVKFSLGNPTDVRGYPASVVFGDKGLFVSVEAHRRFSDSLDVFAFTDNGTTVTEGVPRQTLRSIGLGASKTWGRQWSLSGSLAHALDEAVVEEIASWQSVFGAKHLARLLEDVAVIDADGGEVGDLVVILQAAELQGRRAERSGLAAGGDGHGLAHGGDGLGCVLRLGGQVGGVDRQPADLQGDTAILRFALFSDVQARHQFHPVGGTLSGVTPVCCVQQPHSAGRDCQIAGCIAGSACLFPPAAVHQLDHMIVQTGERPLQHLLPG